MKRTSTTAELLWGDSHGHSQSPRLSRSGPEHCMHHLQSPLAGETAAVVSVLWRKKVSSVRLIKKSLRSPVIDPTLWRLW